MDERAPPRSQASDAIAGIGTNALPALLTLIEARGPCLRYRFETDHGSIHWISNPKRRCRRLGWCSFQALGSKAQPGVPGLVRLLSSPDTECRAAAAIALSYIGPAAENAVIPLRDLVNDPDLHVSTSAIWALGEIRAKSDIVVPALLEVLRNKSKTLNEVDSSIICQVLNAFGKFGAEARDAIPDISLLQTNYFPNVRWHAEKALAQISK